MEVLDLIMVMLQVAAIGTLCWSFLALLGWLLFGNADDGEVQELLSEIYGRQLERRDQLIKIAQQIRSMSTCPDGTHSDAQADLQQVLNTLDAEDERLKVEERAAIVDAQMKGGA
jgi:hypothetical protein